MNRRNGGNFSQDEWEDHVRETRHTRIEDEALLLSYAQMISTATGIPVDNVTVLSWYVPQFIEYVPAPVAFGQLIMYAILALLLGLLAFGLVRRTQPAEEDEIEPELSVEDLLVSTQMEEALDEELLDPIGYEEGSEAKQKLDAFIDEKPDAAASLLRHWLNEAEF
jgi:flagellar M-ring protein FliF